MTRHMFAVGFALAFSAVLGPSGLATAGEQVPFHGTLRAVVVHVTVAPNTDQVTVDGTGQGTQLGAFTFAAPHTVDTLNRTAAGTYEFTAANGDTLSASFTGSASPTATPGVLSIVETATIIGGTGRFAGATGSFTVTRLYDRTAGTTTGSFSGTISSPGAGRS